MPGRRSAELLQEALKPARSILRSASAPRRGRSMSWKTFLAAHAGAIAAADLFTVEMLTRGGLVRYLVLFLIDPKSRRVEIAGISSGIGGDFMAQVARNLTDTFDGWLNRSAIIKGSETSSRSRESRLVTSEL